MTKYCKNCKWCVLLTGKMDGKDYSKCMHPSIQPPVVISLVTGSPGEILIPYASSERDIMGTCGPSGKLFEPSTSYAEYLRDKSIEASENSRRERKDNGYRDTVEKFESEQGAAE